MANTDGKEVVLAVYNTEDADSVCAALLKSDISCVRRKIGSGSGNFLMALNNYGEEIFVALEDVEQAKQVIEQWQADKKDRAKQNRENDDQPATIQQAGPDKNLNARLLAIAVVVIVIVLALIRNH